MYGTIQQHLVTQLDEIRGAGLFKCAEHVREQLPGPGRTSRGDRGGAHEALDRWGYGLASVRFICGTQQIHKQLEARISEFLHTEDTILYSSCFDANGGLFETLLGAEDAVISDELNHASIIDGVRCARRLASATRTTTWPTSKRSCRKAPGARFRLIATDGVFSMDGYVANLPAICDWPTSTTRW
jgi:glycine C-acetyltransferase